MIKKRGNSIRIGSVSGIKIELHYSWFFIFILLAWALSTGFFPVYYPEISMFAVWTLGAISAILLFVSIFLHEMAHSIAAKKNKMKVNKITLFFFGGIAQMPGGGLTPEKEFKMAIAGPLFSLALGIFFYIIYVFSPIVYITAISRYLYSINFIIAVFNMVPGFPLDGGRVFRAILWRYYNDIKKATKIAAYAGRIFAVGLIILGFVGMLFGGFGGLWFILIGFFIYHVSGASYEQTVIREILSKVHVKNIMDLKDYSIDERLTADKLFSKFVKLKRSSFVVMKNKKAVGVIGVENIRNVPKKKWSKTKVSEMMTKQMTAVSPEKSLFNVLMQMLEKNSSVFIIKKNNRIKGVLSKEEIINYLRMNS